MTFDRFFVLSPFRMCFAWWVKTDIEKLNVYVRFRKISFWWNAFFLVCLGLAHYILNQILDIERNMLVLAQTIDIALIVLILCLDQHFCQILEAYAESMKPQTTFDEENIRPYNPEANQKNSSISIESSSISGPSSRSDISC